MRAGETWEPEIELGYWAFNGGGRRKKKDKKERSTFFSEKQTLRVKGNKEETPIMSGKKKKNTQSLQAFAGRE